MDNPFSLNNFSRPKLEMPGNEKKLLLHSCCAPCAGEIMEAVAASEIQTTVYFYNPNIHPKEEYEIRKGENKRFCDKLGFDFVDADYDKENWFERIKGLENEPERGKRCTQCFDMRFERSALYAHERIEQTFQTSYQSIECIFYLFQAHFLTLLFSQTNFLYHNQRQQNQIQACHKIFYFHPCESHTLPLDECLDYKNKRLSGSLMLPQPP